MDLSREDAEIVRWALAATFDRVPNVASLTAEEATAAQIALLSRVMGEISRYDEGMRDFEAGQAYVVAVVDEITGGGA